MRVIVVGASGFVGSAVCVQLKAAGHEVATLRAPRIRNEDVLARFDRSSLVASLSSGDVVINCAGMASAVGTDESDLFAANVLAAQLLAIASREAGVGRLIHVSSAAVQGRAGVLDDSSLTRAFSPYSKSKAEGERRVLGACESATVYRPPGVHDISRDVTRSLTRFASSPFRSVARGEPRPSPQTLLGNVASAVVFLATTGETLPSIVSHPWEGLTTESLLLALGGRNPRRIPATFARLAVYVGFRIGDTVPAVAGYSRRLEVLWFGQAQALSWLTSVGWKPPLGLEAWQRLGADARAMDSFERGK